MARRHRRGGGEARQDAHPARRREGRQRGGHDPRVDRRPHESARGLQGRRPLSRSVRRGQAAPHHRRLQRREAQGQPHARPGRDAQALPDLEDERLSHATQRLVPGGALQGDPRERHARKARRRRQRRDRHEGRRSFPDPQGRSRGDLEPLVALPRRFLCDDVEPGRGDAQRRPTRSSAWNTSTTSTTATSPRRKANARRTRSSTSCRR